MDEQPPLSKSTDSPEGRLSHPRGSLCLKGPAREKHAAASGTHPQVLKAAPSTVTARQ